MERKFKSGDKVLLNSDTDENTPMTVRDYSIDEFNRNPANEGLGEFFSEQMKGLVVCEWRDNKNCFYREEFHEEELRLADS